MRSVGIVARRSRLKFLASSLFVAAMVLAACTGSDDNSTQQPFDDDSAPPLLNDIRSGGPSSQEDLLMSLALTQEDLPPGFVLVLEETSDAEKASVYVSKYNNERASSDPFRSGGGIETIDISVFLVRSAGGASELFNLLKAQTADEMAASAKEGDHHPTGPDFEQIESVEVLVRKLDVPVSGQMFGLEISERVRDRDSGEEYIFFNVSAIVLIDRAVATIDFGSLDHPVSIDELAPFVLTFQERLREGLAVVGVDEDQELDDYLYAVESAMTRQLDEAGRCAVDQDQACLTEATNALYEDLGGIVPPAGSGLQAAHDELHASAYDLWQVNRRSEVEPPTEELFNESISAGDRFGAALETWFEQAEIFN